MSWGSVAFAAISDVGDWFITCLPNPALGVAFVVAAGFVLRCCGEMYHSNKAHVQSMRWGAEDLKLVASSRRL